MLASACTTARAGTMYEGMYTTMYIDITVSQSCIKKSKLQQPCTLLMRAHRGSAPTLHFKSSKHDRLHRLSCQSCDPQPGSLKNGTFICLHIFSALQRLHRIQKLQQNSRANEGYAVRASLEAPRSRRAPPRGHSQICTPRSPPAVAVHFYSLTQMCRFGEGKMHMFDVSSSPTWSLRAFALSGNKLSHWRSSSHRDRATCQAVGACNSRTDPGTRRGMAEFLPIVKRSRVLSCA